MKTEIYKKYSPHSSKNPGRGIFCCLLFLISLVVCIPVFSQKTVYGQGNPTFKDNQPESKIRQAASQTMKALGNNIWFEKNDGQFGNREVLYGFRTSFGSMGVYGNKLRVVTEQSKGGKNIGRQIVDITFPGSLQKWTVVPGSSSDVKGAYNTSDGTIRAKIYNEITLKNVYGGVDLRLYTGAEGALEFDWMIAKAADHKKIRMNFTGQDGIKIEKDGDIVLDLKQEDMIIVIPETYQVINGRKKLFTAKMSRSVGKSTLKYDISGDIDPNLPLVIDPVMLWSTYVHNNTSVFDEYLYSIAVNTASEVYACGLTNQAISTPYMSGVAPGFLSTYTFGLNSGGKQQSVILYRLNPTGTAITAWTYTGQTTNIPVALGIFPDNRVLVVYQQDTIQIFSADLNTRHYSDAISSDVATNALSYQSQAIIDNDVFYLGGVASSAFPSTIIPASAPDAVIAGNEGVILRITGASTTPSAVWGTYVGGSASESFTAVAATPDKSKIAFAVHVNGTGSSYPALVNYVDNTIAGTELLVGVIPAGTPTAFSVFSYLGGVSDEGRSSTESNAALVAADNNFFYVAGNTLSNILPGTAGSAQPAHGINKSLDQFVSQIPLNGSAGTGFITTFNGADDIDIIGGLVIDLRTKDVLLFGTTRSVNFPVYNASAYSPFYQANHGSTASGPLDITYTVFANGLANRKFSTYIGGDHNDYLGSTGFLKGTGHFQYNPTNGFTYIGTTIHSDESTLPSQWMTSIPGFDKTIPPATLGKDNHFIFAMSPNTDDFGDAPVSYEAGNPAHSAVSFFNLRIGDEVDAEDTAYNSATANGDDIQNSGSTDDEDGIFSLPSIALGSTIYSASVSVFNNTGATVQLCGWIDNNGNGLFDTDEYATVNVPSSASQQIVALNFTGLPPFSSSIGFSFLRLRITNVTLTAADATGAFGMGEVEDHIVLQTTILPLSIEQFTAIPQGENVMLNWKVTNEINLYKYQVDHSTDNMNFTSLGTLHSTGSKNYSWLHTAPITGTNYYRLKITGPDNKVTYSNVKNVNLGKKPTITVFPNPAKDIINISATGSILNAPATICLFSPDGKIVCQKKVTSFGQKEILDISRCSKGQYILKIYTDNLVLVRKVEVTRQR